MFEKSTIEAFAVHYTELLKDIAENPGKAIGELNIVSPEEKRHLLIGLNDTDHDYPSGKTVVELIEETVTANYERIAVEFNGQSLTYGELNKRANRLAHYLRNTGVKPDDRVGLMIDLIL